MKDARTYEVMRPEDVGMSASEMVLGKHSGRHAVAKRARELGCEVGDNAMGDVFAAFKRRADEIGALDDEEMRAVLGGDASEQGWSLTRLEARTEKTGKSHAAVVVQLMQGDGEAGTHFAIGETALEAAFLAVRQAAGADAEIEEIEILQAGYGANSEAQAEATVRIGEKSWCGHGRGPDPLWAGVRAIVDAFNKSARSTKQNDSVPESRNEAVG
jgi:2-isopropylmalate synthase